MTAATGDLRLSKGALLFVPDAAPELLLRLESTWTPPPGFKSARARLVLEQRATAVASSSARPHVTPAHGVPEALVGDVVGADGDRAVVDVAGVPFVLIGAGGSGRIAATLAPPLYGKDVTPSAR